MIYLIAIGVFAGLLLALAALIAVAERVLVNYGICNVDINAGERPLDVDGGQTLLSALYTNKLFIPSACGGKGSCGFCKVTVLEGGGPVLPTETPYLSRKEVRSGLRLACQVKIRQNIRIRVPDDMLNVKMFTASVAGTREVTHDIKEIRFALHDPPEISHRPGQYVQVQAPSPDGPVFRAYSISSPTYEKNEVELNVRLVPNGIGSTYLHNLKEGDPVTFTGPYGEFVLNEDPAVEIICVGGGCGMAPMKNIIYSLYSRWPDRQCWLFFGCRSARDVFYLQEFQALARKHPSFHVFYALSDPVGPQEQWDGEAGFIHLSVDKHLEAGVRRQAFLCGPPPMIEAVTRVLAEKGLRPQDIFYDKF
ncbi:MAG: 2Fe-2S iron-sulfur cluster binding domain-containing protein [Planctomycetes bacterium]|nr:2Fe-2S iron-sulfur cluster binding domain-containing protein [Planctomycetota bacterium]